MAEKALKLPIYQETENDFRRFDPADITSDLASRAYATYNEMGLDHPRLVHKSKFDMAGRVYKGVPAPTNLRIPPYSFIDDRTLIIGVNPEGAV